MTSLKEKIGQLIIIGFKGTELSPTNPITQSITHQNIGGVILFDYDSSTKTYDRNIKNPDQLKKLTQQLQSYSNDLPLFIGIDYEGGKVNRLKTTYGFPETFSAAAIAKMPDEKIQYYANEMAATLQHAGINLDFAPVVDLNLNPNNPIIGKYDRSFSSNPQQVIHCALLFAQAFEEKKLFYAYKHFPGHGSSTGDTHLGFVDVTETWQPIELEPYQTLLARSYSKAMVMTSHIVNKKLDPQGYPASLSYAITTDLLRKQLKFNGIVVTDDLQMKAIADHYSLSDTVKLAINAGADLLVFGNQLTPTPQDAGEIIELIYQAVERGEITETRIDEAYQRILQYKQAVIPA